MERSQIHRVSVADQVASILRQKILNGELRPGTPLQEIPLSASLGVSRNTMREATRILSLENLLKRSIHRGVAVSQLSLKDVQEIYHLRRMLEISGVLAAKDERSEVLAGTARRGRGLRARRAGPGLAASGRVRPAVPQPVDTLSPQPAAGVVLSAGHRRTTPGDGAGGSQSRRSRRADSGASQDVSVPWRRASSSNVRPYWRNIWTIPNPG